MTTVNASIAKSAKKILVVDESTFDQCALADLLGRHGYRVIAAHDGRRGYEMATVATPDLILLDVHMKAMDGFAACRLLKANAATATIPVIFLSSAGQPDECIRGLRLGAVDYVGKPYSEGELIARIEVHLKLAGSAAPARADAPVLAGDSDAVLVAATLQLIDQHLADSLSLDDIARLVGSYREKLSRVFQEQRGVSVFAHIREARILRGAELLRASDAAITEIALSVGFSSAGNFATAFRERMGATPRDYRRRTTDDS